MAKLLFFASLRETLGTASENLELPAGVGTVGALRQWLAARGGPWQTLAEGKRIRAAVNQSMADDAATLRSGDEIAFFPPVTGG